MSQELAEIQMLSGVVRRQESQTKRALALLERLLHTKWDRGTQVCPCCDENFQKYGHRDGCELNNLMLELSGKRLPLAQQKDQYGDPIPDDLVVLDRNRNEELVPVVAVRVQGWPVRWYWPHIDHHPKLKDLLLVSWSVLVREIGQSEAAALTTPMKDLELYSLQGVERIDDVLKRFNEVDGFYHA